MSPRWRVTVLLLGRPVRRWSASLDELDEASELIHNEYIVGNDAKGLVLRVDKAWRMD